MWRNCEVCGTPFYIPPSRENSAKYCSKECYNQDRSGNFKYDYDRNFFKKVDSEAKAYFLGFILGDGHLKDKEAKLVSIKIKKEDKPILQKFIHIIGGEEKQIRNVNDFVELNIASQEWVKDLIKLGVPSGKKAFIETNVLKNVPKNLHQHFIRGIFDADGSISIDKKRGDGLIYLLVNITGTKTICSQFKSFFDYNTISISKTKQINGHSHFCTKTLVSLDDVNNFTIKLYKDATIYLERKRKKIEEYKKIREPYERGLNEWRNEHDEKMKLGVKLFNEGLSLNKIQLEYGIPRHSLTSRLKKMGINPNKNNPFSGAR